MMDAFEQERHATPPLVGHEWAKKRLLSSLASGRVSHATLIVGPPNIGKATLARFFAQALTCGETPVPCGVCRSCRRIISGNHPDVRVLDAPDETLKIDQVRDLLRELSLSPHEGTWRVAVLCDFERASTEAANALLKTLEEPPAHVVLILTATEADILLPTIVSRCQVLSLRPLAVTEVQQALISHWGADEMQANLLAHVSSGRLGWAVRALQDKAMLARRDECLDALTSLSGKGRVDRLAYASNLSRNPKLARRETLDFWMSWWRDVLLLTADAQVVLTNIDRMDSLREHTNQVTLHESQRVVAQLRYIVGSLDQNVNLRLAMDVLLLSLPRTLIASQAS
jgi:DNA polymerase-3 subunit delta'